MSVRLRTGGEKEFEDNEGRHRTEGPGGLREGCGTRKGREEITRKNAIVLFCWVIWHSEHFIALDAR